MSTTELHDRPATKRTNGSGTPAERNWSDQVVLSGAGLITESIERTRINTVGLLDVLDELVLGTLDAVDELNALSAQLLPQLGAKPAQIARRAYTVASRTFRQAIDEA